MGRFRYAVATLVIICLAVPVADADAQTRDSERDCTGQASFTLHGVDGGATQVAAYRLDASWCLERVFETTTREETVSEDPSSDGTFSARDPDGTKELKRKGKKGKKGRKGRRGRKRTRRNDEPEGPRTRTRSERRLVSTCITNFSVTAVPAGIDGVDFIGATRKDVPGSDACATRTISVEGRFGRDYITGVPGLSRNVIRQSVSGSTFENYPLGRVGYFNFTVRFHRDTGAQCMSTGCQSPFEFCDLRIVTSDSDADRDSCVSL